MHCAYVTLLTKTSYLAGVLVLHQCLMSVGSKYPLVVMVTPSLPVEAREILRRRKVTLRDVASLGPAGGYKIANGDTRFLDTWTKLRAFQLIEYERVVLLDCDMIVLRNMDELMDLDLPRDHIAAAHVCACNPRKISHYPNDWIPPNCAYTFVRHPTAAPPCPSPNAPRPYSLLNSGTVVLNPSQNLSDNLARFLHTSQNVSDWKFPDQDLLAAYFHGKWTPISWYYNALKTLKLVHPKLWDESEIRCLHYVFADKPWHSRMLSSEYNDREGFVDLHGWWWERFDALGIILEKDDPEGWRFILSTVNRK